MKYNYRRVNALIGSRVCFQKVLNSYLEGKGGNVTFVNPFSYKYFETNPEEVGNFTKLFIDGASLVYLHNLFNANKVDRVSFDYSSIAGEVFSFCEENNLKVGIIGGQEDEVKTACQNIKLKHPRLLIKYSRNGYINSQKELETISLSASNCDILILGMGTPKQEEVSSFLYRKYPKKLIFTCGGFITQTSIKSDYYHPLAKKLGLRWLQRAIMHKHVRTRLISDYPKFYIKYIFSFVFN
ncbi:WecB/TagA/CpsF family glycosyltransferase [uncultured Photobacterium sp.]|uniref:WecB/TagA/CpsF family glycosyltransferase n=1 Tax=uncultured Photobacterium sp. TaxID=173973 RepID=UPI0026151375|nr:WecB/TagA/CpsF family glycosyltransferase [uncultured Photobacterium sp.]